jgi:hypothetical protein
MAGCASPARVVRFNKDQGAGTVAIPNNTDTWPMHNRRAAEDLIEHLVGPGYRIVEEGEFVKGKRKQLNLDSNSASYTSEKITEYRISFVKVPGGPPVTPTGVTITQNSAGVTITQTGAQGPPPGPVPSALPPGALPPVMPGTGN